MLLVYLAASWIQGILLARFLWDQGVIGCGAPGLWLWLAVSAFLIAAAILCHRRKRTCLALVLLLFALLGAWRCQPRPLEPCFTPPDLAFHSSSENGPSWVTLTGVVSDYPDLRDRSANYRLRVHTLEKDARQHEVEGALLLQASRHPEFRYGDELRISGLLQTPPCFDDFCYRAYLAHQSIHSLIKYPKRVELIAQGQGSRFWTAL